MRGAAAGGLRFTCYTCLLMDRDVIELARAAGVELQRRGWWLSTAESCTGGLIGHLVTEVPGSSAYYQGGVVAYANEIKQQVLGVSVATLTTDGAVSGACASEMAAGVRRLFGAEVGIATTGIAGPGGGSTEKPVGLVYIAVETSDGTWCERHVFGSDRTENKQQTVVRALQLLLELSRPDPAI